MVWDGTYCIALFFGSGLPSDPFVGSAGTNKIGTGRLYGVMLVRACCLPSRRWRRGAFLRIHPIDSDLLPFGRFRLGGEAGHGDLDSRSVGTKGETPPSRPWLSG